MNSFRNGSAPAHEILPGLWLGNKASSEDEDWMRKKNITAVFNATKTLPFAPSVVHQYRLPVDDNLEKLEIDNMERWAPQVLIDLIHERSAGKCVLVHCYAGMQRSAALVAMYLIATQDMSADQAIAFVREKRPVAFFRSVNFEPAIRGFERSFRAAIAQAIRQRAASTPATAAAARPKAI